jgi:DDE superfamily endonuclease
MLDVFGAEIGGEIWDRFTIHYTPTHGSWLNQAEIEISLFARQCLGKRRIPEPEDPSPGNATLESRYEPRLQEDQLET